MSSLVWLWQFHHDPLGAMARLARDYGDVVQLRVGSRRYLLFNHPEAIECVLTRDNMLRSVPLAMRHLLGNGLLTSQGEFHRQQRRLMNPSFHRQRVEPLDTAITGCALSTTRRWTDGSTIDVAQEMLRITLAVIVQALLGTRAGPDIEEILEVFAIVIRMTERNRTPYLDKLLARLPLRANRQFESGVDRLRFLLRELILERKSSDLDGTDVLTFLLEAQSHPERTVELSDQQIEDELLALLLAGHETTSNTLTWMWYLVSQYPEVEAHLHEELDAVLGGRMPVSADVPRLTYMRMVLLETLRLYPPVWVLSRRPRTDMEIGKYHVPAWSSLNISPFLMHRDPRYFTDPEQFQPQRWLPEASRNRPRFCYFPFGGGDRQCMGQGFAMMEGPLLAAAIAQRWRLRLVKHHPIEVEPLITLRPKYGMMMTVQSRDPAPSCRRAA